MSKAYDSKASGRGASGILAIVPDDDVGGNNVLLPAVLSSSNLTLVNIPPIIMRSRVVFRLR